jgi:hypothetical protein
MTNLRELFGVPVPGNSSFASPPLQCLAADMQPGQDILFVEPVIVIYILIGTLPALLLFDDFIHRFGFS